MSDLAALVNLLAPFFALIGLGVATARLARLPAAAFAGMQLFLVYLALPCLFFRLIADKPIGELANWRFVAITTACTALAFALAFGAARLARLGAAESTMSGVAGAYSNIGYMGPPLVISLLGPAASAPVALIFVFDTVLLFTLVPGLMALSGRERRSFLATFGEIVRRIALHPFVLATAAALAASASQWRAPAPVETTVAWLSGASAPCALFLLGVTVALQPFGTMPRAVPTLVAIKLVLHPVIVWVALSWLGRFDPVWSEAAVVMAALPPALNIFVLASQYRVGVERASACVLVGTIASAVTLTGLLWLFRTGAIPPVLPG